MSNDEVRFLRIEPEKDGLRDRSKGRHYLLEALVHNTRGSYRISVSQSVGGIDENGRVLFDPQIENTGGQFPEINYIEKIGGHLLNGERTVIMREWRKQYLNDEEIRRAIEEYGDSDIICVYREAKLQYQL